MSYLKNHTTIGILTLLLVLSSFSFSPVNGQEKKFTMKGSKEFGGNISYQRMTPVIAGSTAGGISIFSFTPYVGVFIHDGWELGVNPVEIITIKQSGNTTTQVLVFAAPSYNFIIGDKFFPFIEAQIGYSYKTNNEYSENGFSWGGRIGIKLALVKRGLLNLSLQYLRVTLNPDDVSDRNGFNQILASAGWTMWF